MGDSAQWVPVVLAAIAAGGTVLVFLQRRQDARTAKETREFTAKAAADAALAAEKAALIEFAVNEIPKKIQEIHLAMNSRLDQLLLASVASAHAKGLAEGKAEGKAETKAEDK